MTLKEKLDPESRGFNLFEDDLDNYLKIALIDLLIELKEYIKMKREVLS